MTNWHNSICKNNNSTKMKKLNYCQYIINGCQGWYKSIEQNTAQYITEFQTIMDYSQKIKQQNNQIKAFNDVTYTALIERGNYFDLFDPNIWSVPRDLITEEFVFLLNKPGDKQVVLQDRHNTHYWGNGTPLPFEKHKGLFIMNFNKLSTGELIYTSVRLNAYFKPFLHLFAFMSSVYAAPRLPARWGTNYLFVISSDDQTSLYKDACNWANDYVNNSHEIGTIERHGFLGHAKHILRGCPLILTKRSTGSFLSSLYSRENAQVLGKIMQYSEIAYNYKVDHTKLLYGLGDHNWLSKVMFITDDRMELITRLREKHPFKVTNGIKSRRDEIDTLSQNMSRLEDEFRHSVWSYYKAFCWDKKYPDFSSRKKNDHYIPPNHFTAPHFQHNIGYADYFKGFT